MRKRGSSVKEALIRATGALSLVVGFDRPAPFPATGAATAGRLGRLSGMAHDQITERRVPWQQIVVVCDKCSRKLDGGFGRKGKFSLRAILRDTLKEAGRKREMRVVGTGCLGLCPKGAVTLASSARPQELLTVAKGTDPETVLSRLSLVSRPVSL